MCVYGQNLCNNIVSPSLLVNIPTFSSWPRINCNFGKSEQWDPVSSSNRLHMASSICSFALEIW